MKCILLIRRVIIFILIGGVFAMTPAYANWGAKAKILQVKSYPNGATYFYLNGPLLSTMAPRDCQAGRFIKLTQGLTNFKEIYTNLITAMTLELELQVRDDSGTCIGTSVLENPQVAVWR